MFLRAHACISECADACLKMDTGMPCMLLKRQSLMVEVQHHVSEKGRLSCSKCKDEILQHTLKILHTELNAARHTATQVTAFLRV